MAVSATALTHVGRRAVMAAALGLVMALSTVGSAYAASQVTRTDLTGTTFLNPCTSEPITIIGGTFQMITGATSDGANGLHVTIRGNAQGVVAQGASSGAMYRLAGDFWSEQMIRDPSYPQTFTVVEVHNAVSAGAASNLIVHIVRHLTIDARGVITASVEGVSAECRG